MPIAPDTGGDRSRFTGQRVDATTTEVPIRDGTGLIATARRV